MSLNPDLHKLLIARQSEKELKRKRVKAWRKDIITQEDHDYAQRAGLTLSFKFNGVLGLRNR